eukprot:CAMPEP_0206396402 /NCGR_PEP_ID=MMETSP0294-20121207/22763_1 /ASSEMBLY_ACC=CAM_ASM_000327 /TAXON_ID=39354 /ORGANISM="Heterosigma akashiwo, Strain CCMP2393" /LENGTH=244 /DNA_ID=CAMNT_0053851125 /DNA_START=18 /DNA_END=749 /DNA_ORIENTATION=+
MSGWGASTDSNAQDGGGGGGWGASEDTKSGGGGGGWGSTADNTDKKADGGGWGSTNEAGDNGGGGGGWGSAPNTENKDGKDSGGWGSNSNTDKKETSDNGGNWGANTESAGGGEWGGSTGAAGANGAQESGTAQEEEEVEYEKVELSLKPLDVLLRAVKGVQGNYLSEQRAEEVLELVETLGSSLPKKEQERLWQVMLAPIYAGIEDRQLQGTITCVDIVAKMIKGLSTAEQPAAAEAQAAAGE